MIITIDREFGSGGRELGRRLAEALGIAYYDREILEEIAKKTPYCLEYIESVSESRPVSLLPIHYGQTLSFGLDMAMQQNMDILETQNRTIRDLAARSSCVIMGRASGYLLKDMNPFRIFVYADDEFKITRFRKYGDEGESDRAILKKLKEVDKQRRKYHEFVTGLEWGKPSNYELMVNTSSADLKALAKALADYIKSIHAHH